MSTEVEIYPKIEQVEILPERHLLVTFQDGIVKVYDCKMLLDEEPFKRLKDEFFFRRVKVDAGGYGVSWDEEVDLSEAELWLHGRESEHIGEGGRNRSHSF